MLERSVRKGGAWFKSSPLCGREGATWFPCWAYPALSGATDGAHHVCLRDVYRGGAECSILDSASASTTSIRWHFCQRQLPRYGLENCCDGLIDRAKDSKRWKAVVYGLGALWSIYCACTIKLPLRVCSFYKSFQMNCSNSSERKWKETR